VALTRRDVDTGDWNATLDHGLNDGSHVRFGRGTPKATAKQSIDDDIVGACDEMRLGRHVRQKRDVLQFALLRQTAVERRLVRSARVEDGRTIVLLPANNQSHSIHKMHGEEGAK